MTLRSTGPGLVVAAVLLGSAAPVGAWPSPPAAPAPETPTAPVSGPPPAPPAVTGAAPSAPPAPPAPASPQVADEEAPVRRAPTPEPPPPARAPDGSPIPVRISGNFVGLRASIARGGDSVLTVQEAGAGSNGPVLPAGNGKMVALAGGATFNWWGMMGWGMGVELGWKQESVAAYGGTVTFRRFPLDATIHLIAQAAEHSFLTVSAGVTFDVMPELITTNGSESDVSLDSGFGRLYEAGYHHALGSNFTIDAGLRLTVLDYRPAVGRPVDAKSLSFALGGSYHFDR